MSETAGVDKAPHIRQRSQAYQQWIIFALQKRCPVSVRLFELSADQAQLFSTGGATWSSTSRLGFWPRSVVDTTFRVQVTERLLENRGLLPPALQQQTTAGTDRPAD